MHDTLDAQPVAGRRCIPAVAVLLLGVLACAPDAGALPEDATSGDVAQMPAPVPGAAGTSVYMCAPPGDSSFTYTVTDFNMDPGRLALWLPARFERPYVELAADSGAAALRYQAPGIVFEPGDGSATISVDSRSFPVCRLDRARAVWEHAKLTGVDFRAVGQDPGWILEIRPDLEARSGRRIRFVREDGQHDMIVHAPDPDPGANPALYHGRNGDLTLVVTIEPGPCIDTMSGETFESTVTVTQDGRPYRGCGRPLH